MGFQMEQSKEEEKRCIKDLAVDRILEDKAILENEPILGDLENLPKTRFVQPLAKEEDELVNESEKIGEALENETEEEYVKDEHAEDEEENQINDDECLP